MGSTGVSAIADQEVHSETGLHRFLSEVQQGGQVDQNGEIHQLLLIIYLPLALVLLRQNQEEEV